MINSFRSDSGFRDEASDLRRRLSGSHLSLPMSAIAHEVPTNTYIDVFRKDSTPPRRAADNPSPRKDAPSMPSTSCPYAGDMPGRQKIPNAYAAEHLQSAERHLRFATARLGLRLSSGATILDFGCGIGTSVQVLLGQGYNAFGVDVLEYWGRDFDKYWHIAEKPPAEVAARLKFVDPTDYRLPFEDGTFDFCFSDNVFEHIFDYQTVMSEIMRVLKPAGSRFTTSRVLIISWKDMSAFHFLGFASPDGTSHFVLGCG